MRLDLARLLGPRRPIGSQVRTRLREPSRPPTAREVFENLLIGSSKGMYNESFRDLPGGLVLYDNSPGPEWNSDVSRLRILSWHSGRGATQYSVERHTTENLTAHVEDLQVRPVVEPKLRLSLFGDGQPFYGSRVEPVKTRVLTDRASERNDRLQDAALRFARDRAREPF